MRIPEYFSKLNGVIRHNRCSPIIRSITRPVLTSLTCGAIHGSADKSPLPSSDPLDSSSEPGTKEVTNTGDSRGGGGGTGGGGGGVGGFSTSLAASKADWMATSSLVFFLVSTTFGSSLVIDLRTGTTSSDNSLH